MSYATAEATGNFGKITETPVTQERGRKTNRVKTIVQAYIAAHFRPLRHGAFHLANAAQIESVRTAEDWITGRSWPRDDNLLELCITCNDLQMQLHDLAIRTRQERESK